jgi:hypothetical protein
MLRHRLRSRWGTSSEFHAVCWSGWSWDRSQGCRRFSRQTRKHAGPKSRNTKSTPYEEHEKTFSRSSWTRHDKITLKCCVISFSQD